MRICISGCLFLIVLAFFVSSGGMLGNIAGERILGNHEPVIETAVGFLIGVGFGLAVAGHLAFFVYNAKKE